MSKQLCGSAGGKATAGILRKKSVEKYYANPNYCKKCNKVIEVGDKKVGEIKRKKFCNKSCSAVFNNSLRPKKTFKKVEVVKIKKNYSKKELKEKSSNWWRHRIPIARDARRVFSNSGKSKKCLNCGYDKHIEVCHKKAVSDFSDDAKLSEINAVDNLISLCRNCHWEYDNGLLIL